MRKADKQMLFKMVGGREGISKRILELAQEIVSVDSYKRSIIGAGQLRVLAEIAEVDSYWAEKMSIGMQYEQGICKGYLKVVFDANGTVLD